MSSFFAISDFYIINPESIDFLLYWICIKRPRSSYIISLLQPVSHWTLHRGEVQLDVLSHIEEKPIVLIKKYDDFKAALSNDTIEKFKEILKEEISKINDKLEGKICQLCQDKSFLQEQISELKKQNSAIAVSCEETKQYSRRLCLRVDGVPLVDRETSKDVLEKVKEISAESNLGNLNTSLDRVHRIGKSYFHEIKKVKCKTIIVRFNTFRHCTLVYREKRI